MASENSDTLSKQFCDLNHKRANRREKANRTGKMSRVARAIAAAKDDSTSFQMSTVTIHDDDSLSGDLSLQTFTVESRQQSRIAENTQVRLSHLQDEVQRLIAEKESIERNAQHQMQRLEKQRATWLEERAALIGGGCGSVTAAERIVQLSRKNRDLNAELAAERGKVATLTKELKDAKHAWQARELEEKRQQSAEVQESKDVLIHQLQEKLSQTTSKMADYRNQSQQLKQELRFATKVISQEVGEGVSLQSLSSSKHSNWRGRAQQISALQAKVSDLQQQLSTAQVNSKRERTASHPARHEEALSPDEVHHSGVADRRQITKLRDIERSKREAHMELRNQHECLKSEFSELQQRHDGWRARCKTLTSQVQALKGQVERLQAKAQRDEQLLKTMTEKPQALASDAASLNQKYTEQAIEVHRLQGEVDRLQSLLAQEKPPHGRHRAKVHNRKAGKSAPTALSSNSLPPKRLEEEHKHMQARCINERHDSAISLPPIATRSSNSVMSATPSTRPPTRSASITGESSLLTKAAVETLKIERDSLQKRCAELQQKLNESMLMPFSAQAGTAQTGPPPQTLEEAKEQLDQYFSECQQLHQILDTLVKAQDDDRRQYQQTIEKIHSIFLKAAKDGRH